MEPLKKYILFLFAFAVLFPSGVSFAHVFSFHEHEVCADHGNGHYHQPETDCEYFQFRHQQNFFSTTDAFTLLVFTEISENQDYFYVYFPQKESPSFLLRGPPGRYEA